MIVQPEQIAEYFKERESSPESRFSVRRIDLGSSALYFAFSHAEDTDQAKLSTVRARYGLEVVTEGLRHELIERGGAVLTPVAAAMLGQTAFLQMSFEGHLPGHADQRRLHTLHTPERGSYGLRDGLAMAGSETEDEEGLYGNVDDALGRAQATLRQAGYKASFLNTPSAVSTPLLLGKASREE